MKTFIAFIFLAAAAPAFALIPVFDAASLAQQQISSAETIAKWVESIAQLRTQVDQLNQQISIQGDLRSWVGNPSAISGNINLNVLGVASLGVTYGRDQTSVVNVPDSLASLANTSTGIYRPLQDTDLDGNAVQHDQLSYRRYTVLDAQQQNYQQVVTDTNARQQQLQQDLASTLVALKNASTQAEVEKQTAKINALNGQLAALGTARGDQASQVMAQKAANDSRREEEEMAAAELEARDDYLASQRITAYMQTLKLRENYHENP